MAEVRNLVPLFSGMSLTGFVYDEYGSLTVRFVFDVGCNNFISISLEVTQNQLNSIKPCANI